MFLPLSAVTQTQMLEVPEAIVRRDQRVARSVVVELVEGEETETQARLGRLMAGYDFPEGVSMGQNAAQMQQNEDLGDLFSALGLSIVFIYLLMGFLFESFILPLSIVFTIPLSFIGVAWVHLVSGYDIDFLGAVAVILLVGVVVNNGIVLVDYVNRLHKEGLSRRDAILTATHRRFRPIMMTAITTIFGMVPLAFAGATSIGISYTSFSLTLIGGMSTATLLTLLVIPVFYTLFDDLRNWFDRTVRSARLATAPQTASASSTGTSGGASAPSPGAVHRQG